MKLMLIAVSLAATLAAQSLADVPSTEQTFATVPRAAWAEADPADSLYRAARRALSQKDWESAAKMFGDIVVRFPRSEYAPDALYWKGFALYRSGNLDDAAEVLETQSNRFPKAATHNDASALLILIKGQLARHGDESAQRDVNKAAAQSGKGCQDMEMQVAALDAVQQMDAERVLPLLKRVLARRDPCSTALRKNALFVLAQKSGSDREKTLLDVAKTDPDRGVRQDAVFHLQQAKSDASISALEDLLLHSDERGLRQNALFALSQNGSERARNIIKTFALTETETVGLRNDAVFYLSQSNDPNDAAWLRDAFGKIQNREVRNNLMFHIAQRHDAASLDKLISIAKSDPSPELRKEALFHISQSKDPRALKALEEIVNP
jgi:HEAT repeat protein